MDKIDVFISYRREGGGVLAHLIRNELMKRNISVFLDVEELSSGKFNEKLCDSIAKANNFLLILSKGALDRCENKDDWVAREIRTAISNQINIVPIIESDFVWPDNLPEDIKDVKNYNGVIINLEYLSASIDKIVNNLVRVDDLISNSVSDDRLDMAARISNTYFNMEQSELDRLNVQQNLMREFDKDAFNEAKEKYEELLILDVGSNVGTMIMDRIGGSPNVKKLVGLEWNEDAVKEANQKFGKEGIIEFYQADVSDDSVDSQLNVICSKAGVEKFNVVVISMLILHLKNPHKLLVTIRKHMEKGGMLIVRDIDDGYNIAYPDEDGAYKRIIDMCPRNETSGYRFSGRQIYTQLVRAGFRTVELQKIGMTTVGLDVDEREALFQTYFQFVKEDLEIMVERYPNNKLLKDDLEWFTDRYDDLLEKFLSPDFFFSLGFMLFVARN